MHAEFQKQSHMQIPIAIENKQSVCCNYCLPSFGDCKDCSDFACRRDNNSETIAMTIH